MDEPTRYELEATLAARRELGPGQDDHLVAGFLDRVERELDRRVDERVAEAMRRVPKRRGGSVLHPGNLGVCIPLVAVAGIFGQLTGVVLAVVALALIFVLAELRR